MSRALPKELTSYDFLKTFAVVFMVVDHVGFYFFPDDNWWRVFGRLCVPVWFFLIGYARSRDIGPRLWIGAAILIMNMPVAGISLLPFNILATMIFIRLTLDKIMVFALRNESRFWAVAVMAVLLAIPSAMILEYGTLGFLLAACGWFMRRREEFGDNALVRNYFLFTLLSFVIVQFICFTFTQAQVMTLVGGLFCVMGILYRFKPLEFAGLAAKLGPLSWLLKLTGRRTLEIYVLHILIFTAVAMITQPERFVLLDWTLFYEVSE